MSSRVHMISMCPRPLEATLSGGWAQQWTKEQNCRLLCHPKRFTVLGACPFEYCTLKVPVLLISHRNMEGALRTRAAKHTNETQLAFEQHRPAERRENMGHLWQMKTVGRWPHTRGRQVVHQLPHRAPTAAATRPAAAKISNSISRLTEQ